MAAPRKLHDEFFKKAKAEGYVARSAYKLLEIQERKKVLRAGDRVLDLGCAPGSWLQVASEVVGPRGIVVGIDLQRVESAMGENVRTMQGDIFQSPAEMFLSESGGLYDAVLSDMAPNTSGHGDEFLSDRLCRRVLDLLPALLRPRGHCVMKVLEGEPFPALLKDCKSLFAEAGAFKPRASREVSREIFVVAKGYGPGPTERG